MPRPLLTPGDYAALSGVPDWNRCLKAAARAAAQNADREKVPFTLPPYLLYTAADVAGDDEWSSVASAYYAAKPGKEARTAARKAARNTINRRWGAKVLIERIAASDRVHPQGPAAFRRAIIAARKKAVQLRQSCRGAILRAERELNEESILKAWKAILAAKAQGGAELELTAKRAQIDSTKPIDKQAIWERVKLNGGNGHYSNEAVWTTKSRQKSAPIHKVSLLSPEQRAVLDSGVARGRKLYGSYPGMPGHDKFAASLAREKARLVAKMAGENASSPPPVL